MMLQLLIAMVVAVGGDTLEMRDSTEGHVAELLYINAAGETSGLGTFTLEHNGVTVLANISFAPNSHAELITVTIPDGLHVAVPEQIAVDDGQETVIQIMRPMF